MGETMIRFAPLEDATPPTDTLRHMPTPFLRSIGGDELNNSVALALLGVKSRWVSVLPEGAMGDIITKSCESHGVEFAGSRVPGDIGTFTVLPEEKTVHYQRRNSTFALHDPGTLDWNALFFPAGAVPWVYLTGITPLVSASARASWDNALACAKMRGAKISLDLNHRKQLGSLADLYDIVKPHLSSLELLVLSVEQLGGLVTLAGQQV
ncbi:hypothetical protein CYMTET_43124 [Cymbomonas tetramitiformis]|uniref:Carbohydrate kinase PfkB domain-containing protein n=1 Tax=Cymbomonas tetramitiformis TaxID=36881 RepID=A0AAE0C4F1_9CHLO|nr:hypothetical protein CYMTET_43124 [Cymbomonas tetramitiformis]|eukprot:gene9442-11184_t